MSNTALLFSGQGAQYFGMGKDFADSKGILSTAGDIVGFDVKKMCFEGALEELSQTKFSQPCIMACSVAAFYDFLDKGGDFGAVAGHSLGEYAAMVASGIVSVEDGFKLIKARAEAMQKAADISSGSMYAIIGIPAEEIEKICAKARERIDGYVVPVNYNTPVQTVIAGDTKAVESVLPQFENKKAKVIKLNVASAFHSKLMKPAADEFYEFAKTVNYNKPKVSFYSNLTGEELKSFDDMPKLLSDHIISPVRFVSELLNLSSAGYTNFVELGPGKILTGLVKKTIKTRS